MVTELAKKVLLLQFSNVNYRKNFLKAMALALDIWQ